MPFEILQKKKSAVVEHRADQVAILWRNGPNDSPWAQVRIGFAVFDELGWLCGQAAQVSWGTDEDLGVMMIDAHDLEDANGPVQKIRPNRSQDYFDVTITPGPDWFEPGMEGMADLSVEVVDEALFVRVAPRGRLTDGAAV